MKLPRDLSGIDLAKRLQKFGYDVTRTTGSHIRLTTVFRGAQHHITIPAHATLKIGTLSSILAEVAAYLEIPRSKLEQEIF